MTSVRTVKRWEANQARPDAHEEWFLGLFIQYVQQYGLGEFRERFVRPGPARPNQSAYLGPDFGGSILTFSPYLGGQ